MEKMFGGQNRFIIGMRQQQVIYHREDKVIPVKYYENNMEMIENLYQTLKVYGNNMKMVGNLLKLYGNNMETVETPCHFSSSSIQYTAKMDSI